MDVLRARSGFIQIFFQDGAETRVNEGMGGTASLLCYELLLLARCFRAAELAGRTLFALVRLRRRGARCAVLCLASARVLHAEVSVRKIPRQTPADAQAYASLFKTTRA